MKMDIVKKVDNLEEVVIPKKVKSWRIEVRDETIYRIKAETEEEAIEMALKQWAERQPRIICDLL